MNPIGNVQDPVVTDLLARGYTFPEIMVGGMLLFCVAIFVIASVVALCNCVRRKR